jgi:hypothetical protein
MAGLAIRSTARHQQHTTRLAVGLVRVPNTVRATIPRSATFHLAVGPGDNNEPVVTLMLPGED